jgi:hypothetical protein
MRGRIGPEQAPIRAQSGTYDQNHKLSRTADASNADESA